MKWCWERWLLGLGLGFWVWRLKEEKMGFNLNFYYKKGVMNVVNLTINWLA